MRKSSIEYQDDDYNVVIEIGRASVRMGLTRAEIWFKARTESMEGLGLIAQSAFLASYPPCAAALLSIENLPVVDKEGKVKCNKKGKPLLYPKQLKVEDFTADVWFSLPDALSELLQDATFSLNPHWVPELLRKAKGDAEGEVPEPSSETQ